MKKSLLQAIFGGLFLLLLCLASCSKKDLLMESPVPPVKDTVVTPQPDAPNPPVPVVKPLFIYVKAAVTVGEVLYDSIAADLFITNWDSLGAITESQLRLKPGRNKIELNKKMVKFSFRMHTWNTEKTISVNRAELQEGELLEIATSKAAKKLRSESSFLLIQGTDQPRSAAEYTYNTNGSLKKIVYQQKKPEHPELQFTWIDHFNYDGNRVSAIRRTDAAGAHASLTTFTYHETGFLQNMHLSGFGQETYAYVDGPVNTENGSTTIDYLYSNGQALTYTMRFKDGNKIEEGGQGSTGAGEGGGFKYDQYVNPYNQMNWPDIYLRNLSKNNRIEENKGYSGSVPSVVPSNTVYTYDADGYPTQMIKSYKSYVTGEHLYDVKTLYFY